LALNESASRFWTKHPPARDSRGFPFLDQSAIQVSRIHLDGAYDAYRFGKSLRKAGFDGQAFLGNLGPTQAHAQALLASWVERGGVSRVETDGDPTLAARRRWWSDVPGGPAVIACGGTHVTDLAQLGSVHVTYSATDDGFAMDTRVGG
jgi:alanyl-tRNA synthetase